MGHVYSPLQEAGKVAKKSARNKAGMRSYMHACVCMEEGKQGSFWRKDLQRKPLHLNTSESPLHAHMFVIRNFITIVHIYYLYHLPAIFCTVSSTCT